VTGTSKELHSTLASPAGTAALDRLYANEQRDRQRERWRSQIDAFEKHFGPAAAKREVTLFSAPGRTELAGNHTDHNGGIVLAASIDLDTIAVAAPRTDGVVRLHSAAFPDEFVVELSDSSAFLPRSEEQGTPAALIRGVGAALSEQSYRVGGFDAVVHSTVPVGSGLSSSASVEVLLATIHNHLYNDGKIDSVTMAQAGKRAENDFFGKPCGLMDQIACAHGGIVRIDFENEESPRLSSLEFNFATRGYLLSVVNTGSSHADLTDDYASVPEEMRDVAAALGETRCRDTSLEDLLSRMQELRPIVGDRALLRALHFHAENDRVDEMIRALRAGDLEAYLAGVRSSGNSSWRLLQNYAPTGATAEQSIALAVAVAELVFPRAGVRVHGGGFAGAVQAYVPEEEFAAFTQEMEQLFGEGAVTPLSIRGAAAGPL